MEEISYNSKEVDCRTDHKFLLCKFKVKLKCKKKNTFHDMILTIYYYFEEENRNYFEVLNLIHWDPEEL